MKIQLLLFCISFFVLACSNSNTEQHSVSADTTVQISALPLSVPVDTVKQVVVKVDTTVVKPKTNSVNKQIQQRAGEMLSDAKLNGEPILMQEELLPEILSANPDTVKELVKSHYQNNERNFPRSIADNFEKGTSTERIHYPRLNYVVEVFKDRYATKPYQTLGYSARKENNIIIVE